MVDQAKISQQIHDHIEVSKLLTQTQQISDIADAVELVIQTIKSGHKILLFGNGGSASDAQHIASEFTGRFVKDRIGLPAIALTTDTSALTAIGNDYGFDRIFARQVEALAQPGDLLIGISTSGNSPNVVNGLKAGKLKQCKLIGFSGNDGGVMKALCDVNLVINSTITARIQEMHILVGHILCSAIDDLF